MSYVCFSQNKINTDSIYVLSILNKSIEYKNSERIHKVYTLIIKAQNISKKNNFEELYFISSTELADFYITTENYIKAKEIFKTLSIKPYFKQNNICKFYHRKAFYFNQVGNIDSALYYSYKALKIAKKKQLNNDIGTINNELALIFEKQGNLQKALKFYNLACEIYKNNLKYYTNTNYNKARIYYKLGEYDNTIKLLKEIEVAISKTNWHKAKRPIYFYLSKAYFKKNDSINAYRYLNNNAEELVRIREQEHGEALNELIVKYDIKQKKAEILKQRKLIYINKQKQKLLIIILLSLIFLLIFSIIFYIFIKRKNKHLLMLINENYFLVGEANHRIKNNLQLILSLLSDEYQKNIIRKLDNESVVNISTKIEAISCLHQQLYIINDKSKINLKIYIEKIFTNLFQYFKEKDIFVNVKIDSIIFDSNRSVYIGLLINELLTNGFKHAFKDFVETKSIILIIKDYESNIEILYRDNGVGIDTNNRPRLVDILCKQLKCNAEFKNENGFMFKLRINK